MTSRSRVFLLLTATLALIASAPAYSRELTRFSVPEMKIFKDRSIELTTEDEKSLDQVFRNNTCMAAFLPDDVAQNVIRVALKDEAFANSSKEDLKSRDFVWKRNPQNQAYVPMHAVLAHILRGLVPAGTNLKEAFRKVNLSDVNASILSHRSDFTAKVEALAAAGFRFQVDRVQESAKLGFFGINVDQERDPITDMASQLKYVTKNENGEITYYDSAYLAAYLIELGNLAAGN